MAHSGISHYPRGFTPTSVEENNIARIQADFYLVRVAQQQMKLALITINLRHSRKTHAYWDRPQSG
jgi:hypothetical protein